MEVKMISLSWKKRAAAAAVAVVMIAAGLTSCSGVQASVTLPGASSSVTYKTNLALTPAGETSSGCKTEYFFPRAGQQAQTRLIQLINSSQKNLDMAIYSLTDPQIASAVTNAHKRGVTVRILSDKQQSGGENQKAILSGFVKAGIPVKVNTHSGLMHLKVTIIDRKVATTGSFNYTKSAETKNDEVFVVLNDQKAAQDFESEFSTMWSGKGGFTNFK